MSTQTSSAQIRPLSSYPFYVRALFGSISLWAFLIIACVGSIGLEWAGLALDFWDAGHSQQQVADELDFLSRYADDRFMRIAGVLTDWIYHICWYWSPVGWTVMLFDMLVDAPLWVQMSDSARESVQVVTLRIVISIFTLPAFALVACVSLIEGLVRREIRKHSGGAESSLIFHFAKRNVKPWLITPWVFYLANPFTVHPNWIFIPCLILFGISIAITASTFKKVL
ncbi:DUF4400 domain-containing protein [Denitratimonas sp. CY0512]|jgi:hypothetical protein|uniref:DUF4400 domain-containing protein n=1 Tax=Denitratimonas sp. CY0512 TaxID=3131940 RepID=UPI0030A13DFE